MNRYLKYLQKLKTNYKMAVKISWLNADETVQFEFTNALYNMSGSINVNLQNGARRTCTITIDNNNGKFPIDYNHIWFGQKFQIWMGVYLYEEDIFYLPQGVFCVKNPKETYNPTTNTITLQGVDKWGMLDGSLYGNLPATFKSLPNQDIRDLVKMLLKKSKYSDSFDLADSILDMIEPKEVIFDEYFDTKKVDVVRYYLETGATIYYKSKSEEGKIEGTDNSPELRFLGTDNKYYRITDVDYFSPNYVEQTVSTTADESVTKNTLGKAYTVPTSIYKCPYTLVVKAGETIAKLLTEYATMLRANVFYDVNGYLRFTPLSTSLDNVSDLDKEVIWNFTVTEQEFMGLDLENKFDTTYNDIVILGRILDGKQMKARLQNRDSASNFSIDKIGIKTKPAYQDDQYYSNEQCEELGKYYARTDMAMERAGTFTSLPIYHADVDKLVTLSVPSNGMTQETFLIKSFSLNLNPISTMSLTVTNTRNFTNWTIVDGWGDE